MWRTAPIACASRTSRFRSWASCGFHSSRERSVRGLYGGINGGFEVSCSTEGNCVRHLLRMRRTAFDFGLKGGIGLQVLFIGLDFAYTYGLTDVAKEEDLKINNRAWSLALIIGVG